MIVPSKLKPGDEIRIIAPAQSLGIISGSVRQIATERLQKLGFKVTFGKHVEEKDSFSSSSVTSRIADLHEAFRDPNVKGILTVIGGFNSNHLLKHVDYRLIKRNPKVLCGYSDITALGNAIYAKTGLVTYSGPSYSSFGMRKGFEYTQAMFEKCVMQKGPFVVTPAKTWSDDPWYLNQEKRKFIKNEGPWVIHPGAAEGTLVGGNLCTFQLLHGTEYCHSLRDVILFIEDDEEAGTSFARLIDRDLQSVLHQKNVRIKGVVVGRDQKSVRLSREQITKLINDKIELRNVPVIANADFGHTTPIFTFPIGGTVRISAKGKKATIEILKH